MSETIRELTVQISANGASTAQKDIKGLQNAVQQADAKFRAAGAGIKNFESSTAGMQAKVTMLKDKLSTQQMVVEKAAKAYDAAKAKLDSASKNQQKYAQEVEKARAALAAEVAVSGKDSAASQALAEALKKVEGQYAAEAKAAQNAAQNVQKADIALSQAKGVVAGTEAELKAANSALQKHGSAWAQAGAKIAAAGEKFTAAGKKFSVVGRDMTMGITVPIVAAGTAAFKAFETMDDGFETIIRKTGATGTALDALEGSYNKVFLGVKTTAGDAGIAVGEVNTRFKVTGTQLEDLSTLFIKFADVTEADLNGSIGKTQKILSQWGKGADDVSGFLGLITRESQRTGISVDTLMESIQANGATFKEMGLNLSQSIELMANFEAAGINADTALAALKKSAGNYAKDGLSLEQGLAMTVKAIQSAKTETEALSLAQQAFGAKGALEMVAAIREGRLSVEGLKADMASMGDVVQKTFADLEDDTPTLDRVKNKLVSAGASMGKAMLPWIEQAAGKVGELVDGFVSLGPAAQSTILTIGGISAVAGPAISAIGSIATGIGAVSKLFTGPVGWVALAIAGIAALGISLGSVKSKSQLLKEQIQNMKLNVDTASVSAITNAINTGIEDAKKIYNLKVGVEADTEGIKTKLDEIFSDGKVTGKEYKAASKFVSDMVAPDIAEAQRVLDEKVAAYKASLEGAVDSLGQPLTEDAKKALVDEFTEKNGQMITDLNDAQARYATLISTLKANGGVATAQWISDMDAVLARIQGIREQLGILNDEGMSALRADYNLVTAGGGNLQSIGGAIAYVQGQQQAAIAAADIQLKADKAVSKSNADTTAAIQKNADAVASANTEAAAGYQAIIDGAAKASGATTKLNRMADIYDEIKKAQEGLNTSSQQSTWYDKTKYVLDLLKDPAYSKYLNPDEQSAVNLLTTREARGNPSVSDYQAGVDILNRVMLDLQAEADKIAKDPSLNPVVAAYQALVDSGALTGLDLTKFDGALEGIIKESTFPSLMEQSGKDAGAALQTGIESSTTAAVGSVTSLYNAMIAEANRMKPKLAAAMSFTSVGGGSSPIGGGRYGNPTTNYSSAANLNIENFNASGSADIDILMANMARMQNDQRAAYGHVRPLG